MLNQKEFNTRRLKLMAAMGEGVAIIPTAPEATRNRDSHYPYRFDSHFYYLTGFPEPESILVLVSGSDPKSILFCRDKDMEREIWDGFRHGPSGALKEFGMDEAYPLSKFDEIAYALLSDQPRLFYSLGSNPDMDERLTVWLKNLRSQGRSERLTKSRSLCIFGARLFSR